VVVGLQDVVAPPENGRLIKDEFGDRVTLQVIEWADRALHDQPRFIVAVRVKIVALAYLGRLDEAHAELGRMLALNPGLTIAALRTTTVSFDPEYAQFALAGLRLAGLPEE
jgi:adenylate cyclase